MRLLYKRIYKHFLIVLAVVGIGTTSVLAGGWRLMLRDQADRMARHVSHGLAADARDPAALSRRALETAETLDVDVVVKDASGRVIAEDTRKSWHVPRATVPLADVAGVVVGEVTVSAPRSVRAPGLL